MKIKKGLLFLTIMSFTLSGCCEQVFCNHKYLSWETLKEPTCCENGLKTRKCVYCGKELKDIVPIYSEGHKWIQDTSRNMEATCTEEGLANALKCEYCGELKEGIVMPKLNHDWDLLWNEQPKEYKEATCTEDGVYFEKCTQCGEFSEPFIWKKTDHIDKKNRIKWRCNTCWLRKL